MPPSFLMVRLFLLLFSSPFFSLLPLTFSLFSAGIWGPLLLANARAGCPPVFTRARRALLQHEREAHAGSFVCFFFFFSFSDHRAPLSAPPSLVAPSLYVAPSSRVAAPVASRLRRALRLRHASPPLSRRAFVTHRPCRVASRLASPRRDARFKPVVEMEESVSGWVGRVECRRVQASAGTVV